MNTVAIKKTDSKLQIVYGEVYVPNTPDAHGAFMTPDTIRKMAHNFLKSMRVFSVDQEHDNIETGSYVVESFVARKGDPDFIEGAWVVGVHIPDKTVWQKVEDNEINGFSLQAMAVKVPRIVEMEIPEYVEGGTDETDGHSHLFKVLFSDEGAFIGGETNVVAGHSHKIVRGTDTEDAEGHSHRFSFVEMMVTIDE